MTRIEFLGGYEMTSRIYVAGHTGLLGQALLNALAARGFTDVHTIVRARLDLRHQQDVAHYLAHIQPDWIINAAGLVGGIQANRTRPAEFCYDNLMIQANLIESARQNKVARLITFASACAYPKACRQPMHESDLFGGRVEPTNDAYAMAKLAGLKLCQSYRDQYNVDYQCLIPTNLYGPHDRFDPDGCHVIPALIRRYHEAKQTGAPNVTLWGSGAPIRQFLFAPDLADMVATMIEHPLPRQPINLGSNWVTSIADLASLIGRIVGYKGETLFDRSKPDGHPHKVLDISAMTSLGLEATTSASDGLEKTYAWFQSTMEPVGHGNISSTRSLSSRE